MIGVGDLFHPERIRMSELSDRINRVLERLEWTARGVANIRPNKVIDKVTIQAWTADLFETILLLEDIHAEEIQPERERTVSDSGDYWITWSASYTVDPQAFKREDPNLRAQNIVKRYVKRKRHEEGR